MMARVIAGFAVIFGCLPHAIKGAVCPDDPEVDLCDTEVSGAGRSQTQYALAVMLAGVGMNARLPAPAILLLPFAANLLVADAATVAKASTCGSVKGLYKQQSCCGSPDKTSNFQIVPMPEKRLFTNNMCAGKKPVDASPGDGYFNNIQCMKDGVVQALEQAGRNVTKGHVGLLDAGGRKPITSSYLEAGLCPVNVHWHLGTEHYSAGEYDEFGSGPDKTGNEDEHGEEDSRRLAPNARLGYRCSKFDKSDTKFTTEYDWEHCQGMHVGETYEVHWPHSGAGACGTPYQYQTPFYDGVFCNDGIISLDPLNTYQKIGVQAQIFTIVNDEDYYYPDLMRGMIVDGDYGKDVAKYTGSTTGTSRNNEICSRYTPITWQVDRTCHLISASSFDKMCADMKAQSDDMSDDLHAHGSRVLVADKFAANNLVRLL